MEPFIVDAKIKAEKGESISAINLSSDTGRDLETWIFGDPNEIFNVLSCEFMDDAQYNYILYDHRTGIVYAVQSIDLEFEV